DKYTGGPIVGATVSSGAAKATTDSDGRYRLHDVAANPTVAIAATDYTSQTFQVAQTTSLDAVLRPSAIQGTIVDVQSSKPISDAVVIAMPPPASVLTTTTVYTGTAVAVTHSSSDGKYKLQNVPAGAQIQVFMPGYKKGYAIFKEG